MSELFDKTRILICAGTGGVGKTTISAALGTLAAKEGKRVLILTIDPARRLATALGLDPESDEETRVPEQNFKGELFASLVQPEKTFEKFILRSSASDPERAQRLLKNRLYKQLSTTLSGSQEFTSLERVYAAATSAKYDLIILDTPPAQHAMDFLRAPEKIYTLFNESITKWFVQEDDGGLLRKIVYQGTQTVFKILEKVTGTSFTKELRDFFISIEKIQKVIRQRSMDVHRLLNSAETQFILVTSFDASKLDELKVFAASLTRLGYAVNSVVVNRSFPENWTQTPVQSDGSSNLVLTQLYEKMQNYYRDREKVIEEFQSAMPNRVPVLRLPEFSEEVSGLTSLEKVGDEISSKWKK
jgi:anion-transporting  ArsA/GET3 family ATPase